MLRPKVQLVAALPVPQVAVCLSMNEFYFVLLTVRSFKEMKWTNYSIGKFLSDFDESHMVVFMLVTSSRCNTAVALITAQGFSQESF